MNGHNDVWTRDLRDIGRHDLALVGGKGANLGELLRAGFAVPPGFCVTTAAFAAVVAALPAVEVHMQTFEALTLANAEQVRALAGEIRTLLAHAPIPQEIEEAILAAWRAHGDQYAYGVRSSATAEDLPQASFAGQQDTILNVRGEGALLDAVRRCWASLWSDRATLYRMEQGFRHRDVRLAVVVQRMVVPDVAGIMFTADPVSNNYHIITIDASYGLGEALVSGIVSADGYRVDARTGRILARDIADKRVQVRELPEGGVEQVAIEGAARTRAVLDDAEVEDLARLGARVAAHYGTPQDIEWARADGEWFVLQARPITSLYPLPEPAPADEWLHLYFSFSHFQVMTDAMPPLAASLWRILVPYGTPPGVLENPFIAIAGGRMYLDVSLAARHPLLRRVLPRALGNADALGARALHSVIARPAFRRGPHLRLSAIARFAAPMFGRALAYIVWRPVDGIAQSGLAMSDRSVAAFGAKLDAAPTTAARLHIAMTSARALFPGIIRTWFAVPQAGLMAHALLGRFASRFADPDDVAALGRGLRGNVTIDMDLAVGDLADLVRASPPLLAHLERTDIAPGARLASASIVQGGAAFRHAWDGFIARYGARAPSEIDLYRPRWSEDPASLLQMVLSAAAHGERGSHRAHYERLVVEGDAAAERVVAAARRGRWGIVRGPLVRRLVRVARTLGATREHHKFWMMRALALVKPVLGEAGQQLAGSGRIACADDVWFLTVPELMRATEGDDECLIPRIAERRAAFTHHKNLSPPRVITSDGEIPTASYGIDVPAGALAGNPVSAGVVEGTARVVRDPHTERVAPGEILVAPYTDPGWTPLFINASGLVMEVGGLLTHGSVVAREYGIPAVVGVPDATKRIHTGQRLRVNGTAGYVELLDGPPTAVSPEV
jgi:rifampicin phosphotransferase